jgi:hypothetical protein
MAEQDVSSRGYNSSMTQKYYSTDLTIPIVEIMAETKEQAEAIMQNFIDEISPVMELKIRWDEADWTIQENILDEVEGVWVTQ